MAPVVGADPEQPAQDVGDMAAEDASVRVQLVDDDVAQLLEQQEPLGVVGEDRRVEHVRVGGDDLAGAPDGRPDGRRRVAVVGRGRDLQSGGARQLAELGDLVLAECLGREQQECPRGRIVRDGLQDRHGVAQRLARGGRGHHDQVLAGMRRLDRLRLVAVRSLDAATREAGHDPRIEPCRECAECGGMRWQDGVVDDAARQRRLRQQAGQDGVDLGGGVGSHR